MKSGDSKQPKNVPSTVLGTGTFQNNLDVSEPQNLFKLTDFNHLKSFSLCISNASPSLAPLPAFPSLDKIVTLQVKALVRANARLLHQSLRTEP